MTAKKEFLRSRPHPWHGLDVGPSPPSMVYAFIEITPFDLVKYELDKETGYLMVDRPQVTSSLPPALYGFIPRTYCGEKVGALIKNAKGGDLDPLDICVLSERSINQGNILLKARVVGGLPTLDNGRADDKIIAVLENDALWGKVRHISELTEAVVERLSHYFSTYKLRPDEVSEVVVGDPYGPEHAEKVIQTAIEEYKAAFG
ncbi:MAG: inorganic pyrophosphatase [Anaerolineales bacterium]